MCKGNVIFTDEINIRTAGAGVYASDYSSHGNQQMRVVHTTHGDYLGYPVDMLAAKYGSNITELGLIKVLPDGSTRLLHRNYKPYGSSSVSLVCDNDENVWAVVMEEKIFNEQSNNRAHNFYAAAYCIDAKTDKVRGYTAIISAPEAPNCGKTELCYDPSENKIYVFTARAIGTQKPAEVWVIFDVAGRRWQRKVYCLEQDLEYHYKYIYPDGKGGIVLVDNRATTAEVVGYPENANNFGPTAEEWATVTRRSAQYVWDGLQLLYIPDVTEERGSSITAVEADYSRVKGDISFRHSLAGRYSNWYPVVNNNNGGDLFRDSRGYYHLIFNYKYVQSAGDRTKIDSSIWYHDVYDAAEPNNMHRLSRRKLFTDIENGRSFASTSWRMTESTDGVLYIISGYNDGGVTSLLRVFELKESDAAPHEYEYTRLAQIEYCGAPLVTISNDRGNSYGGDDIVDVIYKSRDGVQFENCYNDDFLFRQIKLPTKNVR